MAAKMTKFQARVCLKGLELWSKDEFGYARMVSLMFEPVKLCNQKLDQETTPIGPISTLIGNSHKRKAVCGEKASHEKFRNSTFILGWYAK